MKSAIEYDILIQGGGPVGLACAAWCLQKNPGSKLVLVDRNPIDDADLVSADSRGIALSHGSKLLLDTINAWPTDCADIHRVHVSQAGRFGRALMTREELGQDALGHIIRYRDIHLALRKALRAIQTRQNQTESHFSWLHVDNDSKHLNIQAKCIVHAEGGLFKKQDWVESGCAVLPVIRPKGGSLKQLWAPKIMFPGNIVKTSWV